MQWLNFLRYPDRWYAKVYPSNASQRRRRKKRRRRRRRSQVKRPESLSLLTQFVKRPVPRTRHVTDLSPSSVCVTNPRGCVQGHAIPRSLPLFPPDQLMHSSSSISPPPLPSLLLSSPRFNIAIVDRSSLREARFEILAEFRHVLSRKKSRQEVESLKVCSSN